MKDKIPFFFRKKLNLINIKLQYILFGLWRIWFIVDDDYEYDLYEYKDDLFDCLDFGMSFQNKNTIEFSTDSISAIKIEQCHLDNKNSYIYMKLRNQPQFSQFVSYLDYESLIL